MINEIKVPDIGLDEVEVTEILVKSGDKIEVEQSIITVEGDKVLMEIPAPFPAIVKELKVSVGDKIKTNSLIMIVEDSPISSIKSGKTSKTEKTLISEQLDSKIESDICKMNVHATPLVRRLASKFGINLAKIKGNGPKGRILKEDLQDHIKNVLKSPEMEVITTDDIDMITNIHTWPEVDFSKFGEIEEINLGRIQKISGANLSRNWNTIPHVTHFDKADITELEKFRKQQNIEVEKYRLDTNITILVFVIKVIAIALKKMPRFNSSLSKDRQKLILKKYVNIGIAVDTPNGLMVPVLKNVANKNIIELARELTEISKKSRDGRLSINDIQGGGFTISSLGNLGTKYFTPIVNAPEVAILGISKSVMEPIWNGREFIPRLMLPISLSFDHRVIDGAEGARFTTMIIDMLFDIRRIIM